jgi:hypothetical protein
LLPEPGQEAGDRFLDVFRDGDPFDDPADLRCQFPDRLAVFRLQQRQPIEQVADRRRCAHDPLEGFGRDAEAIRHAEPFEPGKLPQVRAFPPAPPDVGSVDLLEAKHIRT